MSERARGKYDDNYDFTFSKLVLNNFFMTQLSSRFVQKINFESIHFLFSIFGCTKTFINAKNDLLGTAEKKHTTGFLGSKFIFIGSD